MVSRFGVKMMRRGGELVAGTGGRQDRSTVEEHTSERRVQDSQEQIQEDETACAGVSADRR